MTATNADVIADGLQFLTGQQPLIVALGSLPHADDPQDEQAEGTVRERGVWVTDPEALDTLNAQHATRPPATTLLSHALIEGGRGITPAPRIAALISDNARGFAAAAAGEEGGTGRVVVSTLGRDLRRIGLQLPIHYPTSKLGCVAALPIWPPLAAVAIWSTCTARAVSTRSLGGGPPLMGSRATRGCCSRGGGAGPPRLEQEDGDDRGCHGRWRQPGRIPIARG